MTNDSLLKAIIILSTRRSLLNANVRNNSDLLGYSGINTFLVLEEMWCLKPSMRYRFQIISNSTRRSLLNANVRIYWDIVVLIRFGLGKYVVCKS